ncbi:unnamed protein product [Pleuronectes platessa]|uniref:Uncharacterized protein n=1 Tax=Pleuronectes platessa TaxID=8262 RepID=A0A9N7U2G9_PLEPL|nr:unnamed protein product [Pleuronectes platessa]
MVVYAESSQNRNPSETFTSILEMLETDSFFHRHQKVKQRTIIVRLRSYKVWDKWKLISQVSLKRASHLVSSPMCCRGELSGRFGASALRREDFD